MTMTDQKLQIYPGGGTTKLGGLRYRKRSSGQGEQGLLPGLGLWHRQCHCLLLGQLTQSNETSYRLTVWAVKDRSGLHGP